jgi:hypothetical protein
MGLPFLQPNLTLYRNGRGRLTRHVAQKLSRRDAPTAGVVSANVRWSLDGEHVTNYAQWRMKRSGRAFSSP